MAGGRGDEEAVQLNCAGIGLFAPQDDWNPVMVKYEVIPVVLLASDVAEALQDLYFRIDAEIVQTRLESSVGIKIELNQLFWLAERQFFWRNPQASKAVSCQQRQS